MNLYPLMLDLVDRLTVVIGGGPVAVRKAAGLLGAGARVRMVCPDLKGIGPAGEFNGEERVERVSEEYCSEHLDGAVLVFAAATPEVNAQVVADAKARRIWVNSADDPQTGDFFIPAVARRGELVIAVGTGGAAPAAASYVRDLLDKQFDDSWAIWLEIQRELRPIILQTVGDRDKRRMLFDRLADPAWLPQIRAQGRDTVRAAMRQVVEESGKR
jgi:precorrin-2 dehydrogenase / sirohydrochlorin ferrochelatase